MSEAARAFTPVIGSKVQAGSHGTGKSRPNRLPRSGLALDPARVSNLALLISDRRAGLRGSPRRES